MSSRAEVETLHRLFQGSFASLVEPAVLGDEPTSHIGIRIHGRLRRETLKLNSARLFHPFPYRRGGLPT